MQWKVRGKRRRVEQRRGTGMVSKVRVDDGKPMVGGLEGGSGSGEIQRREREERGREEGGKRGPTESSRSR